MTLVEFLLARYDEREHAARAASQGTWVVGRTASAEGDVYGSHISVLGDRPGQVADMEWSRDDEQVANAEHIALNDPAYVLADIAAKRLQLAEHEVQDPGTSYAHCRVCHNYETHDAMSWPCRTVLLLALPFTSYPDYDEAWRPS